MVRNRYRQKVPLILVVLIMGLCTAVLTAQSAHASIDGVQAVLQDRFRPIPASDRIISKNPMKNVSLLVRDYYERQAYRPVWTDRQAEALVAAIREADQEGLDPSIYPLHDIESLIDSWRRADINGGVLSDERRADFDILLTRTFLTYGLHLSMGRFDPEEWFMEWVPYYRPVDLLQALLDGQDKNDLGNALKGLAPRHPSYIQMRRELADLRKIAAGGGWPLLPGATRLKRGDHGRDVILLKHRLTLTGDLSPENMGEASRFDAPLEAALRKFQWRHGLILSGVLDQDTRAAMNVPIERRIRQMEINMERWRWLPDDFGPRYVMTIIPDLWLYVVDDQKTILSMKTVIGTPQQPSPIFSDEMSYLEINPTWGLPTSIIAKEIIPKIRKEPDYLVKKRIRIYRDWSEKAKEIDPQTIDWAKINPEKFPYRMVQDPGVNPLGRIKFMFPNEFDVYLHDTTQRYLFQRHRRLFSHGCIRVEKPFDLGEWVLRDNPSWSRERILAEIKKGKRLQVNLPRTVPVHVMYLTAWVDGNDFLQFRNDYYGYDKIHEDILKKR